MKAGRVEDRDQDGRERQVGFRSFSIRSGHNASRFGTGTPSGGPSTPEQPSGSAATRLPGSRFGVIGVGRISLT
jgi:hypothetical protein